MIGLKIALNSHVPSIFAFSSFSKTRMPARITHFQHKNMEQKGLILQWSGGFLTGLVTHEVVFTTLWTGSNFVHLNVMQQKFDEKYTNS